MSDQCSFERLVKLLDKQLDIDTALMVYDHIDRCDVCREAIYLISRDRDCDDGWLRYRSYQDKDILAA